MEPLREIRQNFNTANSAKDDERARLTFPDTIFS